MNMEQFMLFKQAAHIWDVRIAWNQTEKSWDCPCHGARYSVDGTVLNGPSDRDLEYINVELLTGKE